MPVPPLDLEDYRQGTFNDPGVKATIDDLVAGRLTGADIQALSIALSAATAVAVNVPNGGIYSKYALFGDNGDTSLGVIGTTNLETLRFLSPLDISSGSDIHDLSHVSLARTSNLRITPTADIQFTGIVGAGDNGRTMAIQNASDTYSLIFRNNHSGSTAGNRFRFPRDTDFWVLPPLGKAMFWHELTGSAGSANDCWKCVGWGSNEWPTAVFAVDLRLLSITGPRVVAGAGTPEGSVSAPVGSLYMRTDGGAGTSIYVKESGTGNTGWVAK